MATWLPLTFWAMKGLMSAPLSDCLPPAKMSWIQVLAELLRASPLGLVTSYQ